MFSRCHPYAWCKTPVKISRHRNDYELMTSYVVKYESSGGSDRPIYAIRPESENQQGRDVVAV